MYDRYNHGYKYPRRSRGSRGNASFSFPRNKVVPLTQLMKGLGEKVDTIPVPSSNTGYSNPVSIQNLEAIASYSCFDSKDATIIVPGSPPIWRERQMPYSVPRDSGTVFVGQNVARLSSSSLPLVAAVSHHSPTFPLHSVDFITDRNALRKLWRWATNFDSGGSHNAQSNIPSGVKIEGEGAFRIDVELVGEKTILMERWEAEMTQEGGPGYEREFESASTSPADGCEGATGHHRIVTYDLGDLKMLMRFKTDTCLPAGKDDKPRVDSLDELVTGFKSLSVKKSNETEKVQVLAFGGASLSILSRGTLVPQASLVELKTRSRRAIDNFEWDDTYAQLLLSQTPHVFVCVHERGEFQEVKKKTLQELETEAVARKAQEGLRKLGWVLGEIADMVRREGEGERLSLVCKDRGGIVLYERKGARGSLPDDILGKFSA